MAKGENRFQIIQQEAGRFSGPHIRVLLDTNTGVQYLFVQDGYAGGLCPLLDRDGKPMIQNP